MPTSPCAIEQFRAYLERRNYAPHTLDSDPLDLQVFFATSAQPPEGISFREIDRCIEAQQQQGLSPATINRRLYALKHVFDFRIDHQLVGANPVKPSHVLRRSRALPRALSQEQLEPLFAQIQHPMDTALFLLMLRCGLRVSEAAQLKLQDIDWSQQAVRVDQGKGRKDRQVYLSADTVASLQECLKQRPRGVPGEAMFWNQKRPHRPLSVKAIQKKMERCATAAGVAASCHRLRHTFASHLLEQGAEIIAIKELLGHASIGSSERYAKVSNQKVKQVYLKTIGKVMQQSNV
ncbi:MAG: tyrosine-type recombinase/integrase [Nitrospinae bacterium]|nr:tyrosine-type recombinase/integrase [Nitrospinota bacterium]